MIDGLRPYAEMRPTGLRWLDHVPAHWEVRRIKTLLKEVDNRSKTGEERLFSLRMRDGLVDHHAAGGKAIPADALIGFKIVEPGQVVMNRMRASTGLFGVATDCGLVSPDYAVFEPNLNVYTPYLLYLFRIRMLTAVFRAESKGLGTGESGFLRLYTDRFGPISVPYPPLDEQRLIVRFLDWHGAQTAKLIQAKGRTFTLLNEQKRSIVHQAMSSGLDPHAELRPSGSPWLGNMPSHWTVKRLRNVAELRVSNVDKNSSEDEIPIRLCNYVDVYKNEAIHPEIPFMTATASEAEIERFRLRIGDVIITKDSEDWKDIGIPALVATEADDLVCGYHLGLLRPIAPKIDSAFLYWRLLSPDVQWQLSVAANGITRYGLSHGSIKGLVLSLPELQEQQAIAAHLDAATGNIRSAERVVQAEISLVQELRARLIAEVVTGKLDVREVAAALPEQVVHQEGVDPEEHSVGEDFEPEEAAA